MTFVSCLPKHYINKLSYLILNYLILLLMMFTIGSFPFEVLSSVMKYAICSSMMGPLILISMTPLHHGGVLSVDLNVPIVAF